MNKTLKGQNQKGQLLLLRCWEPEQRTARPTAPCLPSPHLRDQLSPPQEESKGIATLFSLSHTMAPVPIRPYLNFLSGFLSVSID